MQGRGELLLFLAILNYVTCGQIFDIGSLAEALTDLL